MEHREPPSAMLKARARVAEVGPGHALGDIKQRLAAVLRGATLMEVLTVAGWA